MYFFNIWFYIELFVYVSKASVCFDDGTFLKDDNFLNMKISAGIIATKGGISRYTKCETVCKRYHNCVSYFYNPETRICQLNSIVYLSTEGSEESSGTVYYRKRLECPSSPPSVAHAVPRFYFNNVQITEGTELKYDCDYGYIRKGVVICQINGQWSTVTCHRAMYSCSEVHQCNNSYSDNHYWISLPAFTGNRAKIYCHNLSGDATEFVSLTVPNVGYYPYLYSYHCIKEYNGRYISTVFPGETRYNKIKINIQTLEVNRSDTTFADQIFKYTQKYGEANDCYTPHFKNKRGPCGPKGTFNIDLTGTGLKVDPQLTFKFYGWSHWGEDVWSADGTKIDLLCGGWAGGCRPNGTMSLKLNQLEEPPENSAIIPVCENQ